MNLRLPNDFDPCLLISDPLNTSQGEYHILLDTDWLRGGHMAQAGPIRAKDAYFWDLDGNAENEVSVFPPWLPSL